MRPENLHFSKCISHFYSNQRVWEILPRNNPDILKFQHQSIPATWSLILFISFVTEFLHCIKGSAFKHASDPQLLLLCDDSFDSLPGFAIFSWTKDFNSSLLQKLVYISNQRVLWVIGCATNNYAGILDINWNCPEQTLCRPDFESQIREIFNHTSDRWQIVMYFRIPHPSTILQRSL